MNKYKRLFIAAGAVVCFLPLISCSCWNSGSFVLIDKEIAQHDENAWETTINEIANTDCPTIYLTVDAAYFLMEAASIYYTSSELAIKQHNTNPYADQIMLISYKNFKYKTKESSTTGNFNYSYENLLGDAKGKRTHEYKDILQYGVEEGNHGVITNYEDFNGEPNYSPDADNDSNKYWLYTYDTTVMILEKLYSMYDEKNPNQKFNFVMCDYPLEFFIKNDPNKSLNLQESIYSRANKIYWLSDGAYSYFGWCSTYAETFRNYGYTNYATQKEIWNKLHDINVSDIEKKELITKNPIIFLDNEQFCSFMGADGDFYRTHYGENYLCPATMTKYAYSNINWLSYQSIFNFTDNEFNDLIKSIISFFDDKNADDFIKDEDNFIDLYATDSTKSHFNPDKKSIIIPTDSFIVNKDEIRDKNVIDIFDKMTETFKPEQYNYVLKSHPRIDESVYDERMHELFAKYYDDITILKPKYPLEQLILFDWYNQSKPSVNNYCLLDPLSYIGNQPSGLIGGWSLLTTSIISMLNLVANYQTQDHLDIGNKNALKMINTDCVFVPKNFELGSGATGDMYSKNMVSLVNMYQQFFILGKFIDLNLLNAV